MSNFPKSNFPQWVEMFAHCNTFPIFLLIRTTDLHSYVTFTPQYNVGFVYGVLTPLTVVI